MSRTLDAPLTPAALVAFAVPTAAQERPIKIIAPLGARGPGDVFSR
jgi:hypothetical protein